MNELDKLLNYNIKIYSQLKRDIYSLILLIINYFYFIIKIKNIYYL